MAILTYIGNHTKNTTYMWQTYLNTKTYLQRAYFCSHLVNRSMIKRTVRKFHTKTTNQLGYNLAYLIEGDGSIILRKRENEKNIP